MANIEFRIDGQLYGSATATTYNLDGTVKETYTAGANVTIVVDTSTMLPTVLFQANIKQIYGGYFKFGGWFTKEYYTDGSEEIILNGIKDNNVTFSYNVIEHGTTFVRANFTAVEGMLTSINVLTKNTVPSLEGIASASGGGIKTHLESVKITANFEENYVFNDTHKWKVTSVLRSDNTSTVTYYDTETIDYTVNGIYKSVTFECQVNRLSVDAGDFTLNTDTAYVGGYLGISLSNNIYKQGCVCKWLLMVPSVNSVNSYTTYGDNDWLYDIWSAYSQPTQTQGVVYINLPMPSRLTEIFSGYNVDISSLDCKLVLQINSSSCTEEVYLLNDQHNYRNFSLAIPNDYKPRINNVSVTYDKLYTFTPTGSATNVNLLVAGWSRFKGSYTVESIVDRVGGGTNYLTVEDVSLTYNDAETTEYTHGEDYQWVEDSSGNRYGTGSIGSSDYITFGQNGTTLVDHEVTISATNTANVTTNYVYTNTSNSSISSPLIYGWYQPIYNLLEIYRCDSNGVIQEDLESNNCIYLSFSLQCAPVTYNNVNYNYIETETRSSVVYAKSTSLRIKINGGAFGTDNNIIYDGDSVYHVIIGNDSNPLDFNSNYTICVYYRDLIKKYFEGTPAVLDSEFYLEAQPVCASMPLSLYQADDTNKVGVGVGVEATNPGYVTLGADSIFDTDITITASKTVPSPEGSGTSVVTAQVNAYDLVKEGDTVCVPATDIENGLYVNNIRLLTRTEYTNLLTKDSHTMYIIYKE